MKKTNKNIFPKLSKKLKWFLTDESGKITKRDALWLSAWAMFVAGLELVDAAGCAHASTSNHGNNWHINWSHFQQAHASTWGWNGSTWIGHGSTWGWDGVKYTWHWSTGVWTHWSAGSHGSTDLHGSWYDTKHSSWLVNWHHSVTPNSDGSLWTFNTHWSTGVTIIEGHGNTDSHWNSNQHWNASRHGSTSDHGNTFRHWSAEMSNYLCY